MLYENLRLAFSDALFTAKAFKGEGKAAFSCTFIVEPNSPAWKQILATVKAAAAAKWGKHADDILAELIAKDRVCYSDKPKRNQETREVYAGFEGNCWISARNDYRPAIVDRDGVTPLLEGEGKPFPGCYVNADLDIYAQDSKSWGRRINCSLIGVQYVREGEAFGGRRGSANAFASLAVEDEDDGLGS